MDSRTLPIANRREVDPGRIRCIAFDAVGTLIHPTPPAAEAYFQFARRHGSQLSADLIATRFRAAFRATERGDIDGVASPPEKYLATSEAIEYERWRSIVAAVIDDIPSTDECFAELFAHFADPASWKSFDDVTPTLSRLRAGGIGIALASNFDGRLHAVCQEMTELRDVTCRVVSSEVGFRKPSPQFYAALLATLECAPDELLMVGDDRENDSEGASFAGIPAILVNRKGAPAVDEISSLLDIPRWLGL
jgi:putative hydrolase of the HAD superfamily